MKKTCEKKLSFAQRVYQEVAKIPVGETRTYREIAIYAGSPRAYRAVGNILKKNFHPDIPCHRVIRSDGCAGGYNRGSEKKKQLLIEESMR